MNVAVVGAGPAGLIAAEILSAAGHAVTVYERMPSPARKFLMAGRGGLNLTHSEPFESFLTRYGNSASKLKPMLEAFPPSALIDWANGLGQETFIGSSGRVFPKAMKASPLLRAWLQRLSAQGVRLETRHDWRGWNDAGDLQFRNVAGETVSVRADATVLALGGASWPRLGSDGSWVDILRKDGVAIAPLAPANCGVNHAWSDVFRVRHAGEPLKNIALSAGDVQARGEAIVTDYGLEGGAIYALGAALRGGNTKLVIDLRPDMSEAEIAARIARVRRGQSVTNVLRKALHLAPVAVGLLREAHGVSLPSDPPALAHLVKHAAITVTGSQPMARAISTAGGVPFDELDGALMLKKRPDVYVVGEMLDWEAPTGGYLLQASFATGTYAAREILAWAPSTR